MLHGERLRIGKQVVTAVLSISDRSDLEFARKLNAVVAQALSMEGEELVLARRIEALEVDVSAVKAGVAHLVMWMLADKVTPPHPQVLTALGIGRREAPRIVVPGR